MTHRGRHALRRMVAGVSARSARAGAAVTHLGDLLPCRHLRPLADEHTVVVGIGAEKPRAMPDDEQIAIVRQPAAAVDHLAVLPERLEKESAIARDLLARLPVHQPATGRTGRERDLLRRDDRGVELVEGLAGLHPAQIGRAHV